MDPDDRELARTAIEEQDKKTVRWLVDTHTELRTLVDEELMTLAMQTYWDLRNGHAANRTLKAAESIIEMLEEILGEQELRHKFWFSS